MEEVRRVVPETDAPSLPVMTFWAWFIGTVSCTLLIFYNTFFSFRTQPLSISAILMQILVLPIGKFMAAIMPNKEIGMLGWSFNLNPGPFNMKEHVIITIFANCGVWQGGGDTYSVGDITVMKACYKQSLSFVCGLLIVLSTQVLGYGWVVDKLCSTDDSSDIVLPLRFHPADLLHTPTLPLLPLISIDGCLDSLLSQLSEDVKALSTEQYVPLIDLLLASFRTRTLYLVLAKPDI